MPETPRRVSTVELAFDLVFVFTLTQLTSVLYRRPDGKGLLQVVLMLGVVWWMYGGYAWMTNAVSAQTNRRRALLFLAMAAYFVLALAIPGAYDGSGLAFGLSYLLIVVIHGGMFTLAGAPSTVRAIFTLAPMNVAAAVVVVAGGAVGGGWQYGLWAAAGLFEWLSPLVRGNSGFLIAPSHFVERHGLVVIVALGESVVAVGVGASHLPVDPSLVAVAVVGLALSACLWWLYFGGDESRAERALLALEQRERALAALRAYGYWHLLLLLGIVAIAAVEREAMAHPFSALSWWRAALLAGGVATFLLGDVLFRRELAISPRRARFVAACVAALAVPVGALVSPFAETGALVVLLVCALVVEPLTNTSGAEASGSPARA